MENEYDNFFQEVIKMLKKIIAIFALLALCISFASCANDGTPKGMKSATVAGEPFILYVPEAWTDNTSSGISGAFVSDIAITARYRTVGEDAVLSDHVSELTESYSASLVEFKLSESTSTVLAGNDAALIKYSAKRDDLSYSFIECVTIYKGDAIYLKFFCPTSLYEQNATSFDVIKEQFVLCDKPVTVDEEITDKNTPEGMKIASGDNVEYLFYVPKSWICTPSKGANEAYVAESGRPNVTVTSFYPDSAVTPDQYFETAEEDYKQKLSGYTLLSRSETSVDGRDAVSFTYSVSYAGVEYKIMQTVTVYGSIVYSLTYTSPSDVFDSHLADVEAMISAFAFR